MFRHDYIAINAESVTTAHSIPGYLEDSAACVGGKKATTMVTAECDEMTLTTLVKTCHPHGMGDNLLR
jgi:hypothetical protein